MYGTTDTPRETSSYGTTKDKGSRYMQPQRLTGTTLGKGFGFAKYSGREVELCVQVLSKNDPMEVYSTGTVTVVNIKGLHNILEPEVPIHLQIFDGTAIKRFTDGEVSCNLRIKVNEGVATSGLIKIYPRFHLSRLLGHLDIVLRQ